MRNQLQYLIKPFLLMVLSFLLIITSCNQAATQSHNVSIDQSLTNSQCRVVQHKLGEICIPVQPQRIIALDPRYILDPLLALEIKPIGFAAYIERGRTYLAGLSPRETAGIEIVGNGSQSSLEKITTLKPDLILALDDQAQQNYKQLSSIAPTVVIDYDKIKFSFKENLRAIAQLFNQEEKAKAVLAQYQDRIEKIKDQLGSKLDEIEISVITLHSGGFWLASDELGISQVLTDIGLHHKTVSSNNSQFSIETISEHNTNIIFFLNADRKPSSYFLQHPLISSLKAVKNKRAYVVDPDVWWAYGPIGINRLLDELSKYLLEAAQSF